MNKNILKTALLALVAVGISFQANAQQGTTKEEPVSFSQKNLIWKDSVIVMPELDMDAIRVEDSIDKINHRLPRMGYPHHVNFNLENSGEWKTLSNGDRIWHLVLACPGANSMFILFDKFWLPEGAKLFLYGKNTKSLRGPFTSVKNKKGTKENPDKYGGAGIVYDDVVVVEYYEPKNVLEQGIVSISVVTQYYRGFDKSRYHGNHKGLNSSDTCQVNINCKEGWRWQNEKNAVAMFSTLEGSRFGTGALINNTANNKRPFFLTANHCLEGEDAISNPNCDWIFWWHYESPNCNNLEDDPDYYVTTEGATVLANDSVIDFALLELDEDPDDNPNIMTYYLGWDNRCYLGDGFVGIHHPRGDLKKISTYKNVYPSIDDKWIIKWKQTENGYGYTEPVSSGSPLINGSRRVMGCLYGGSDSTNCSNMDGDYSSYNQFCLAWDGNGATDNRRKLQPWLDPLNTGATTLDGLFGTSNVNLYIRDSINDNGNEPTNVKYMYNSPDIWIGDSLGNPVDDIYGGGSYYVCVRIHNKRAVSSTGTEKLYLNWAKAGVNLPWPSGWDGTTQLECGKYPPMSGMVGDSSYYPVPIILPYSSVVVKIPWTTPDAEEYDCGIFESSAEQWHFCLLARVHDSEPIEGENADSCDIGYFVTHNNNVAWKNLTVLGGHSNRAVVWLQNHFNTAKKFRLHFTAHRNSKNESLSEYAETYIRFSPNIVAGWQEGGSEGNGFEQVEEHRFFIPESSAEFKNILLPPNSIGMLETEVNFFSDIVPECGEFTFDIAMYDEKGETLYGGEHYKVVRDPDREFEVKALEDQVVMPETPITFSAVNIGEPASYVWYNAAGDSIASGTTLSTTATQSQQYRLSVQATADGYKGYDTVSVVVRNGAITAISPNPATNQAVVSYTLSNQVQSGTVQIANTTGIVLSSTAFTASQTSTTLNLQNLVAGQYNVRLVSVTGEVLDTKTLIIQ